MWFIVHDLVIDIKINVTKNNSFEVFSNYFSTVVLFKDSFCLFIIDVILARDLLEVLL